jgi:hypothetical protein
MHVLHSQWYDLFDFLKHIQVSASPSASPTFMQQVQWVTFEPVLDADLTKSSSFNSNSSKYFLYYAVFVILAVRLKTIEL